jgi:hypothetical protein
MEEREDRQTLHDEALDLFALETHEPGNQHTSPPGVMMIVWLPPLSQDPIPAAAVTGRHLMRMESDDNGGSEAEETREALTTREMGIIFPGTK